VLLLLAQSLCAHGTRDVRIQELNQQLKQNPNNAELYLQRGRVWIDSQVWSHALDDTLRAERIQPELHEALYWQGYIHYRTQKFTQAKQCLERYITLAPQSPAGHTTLAQVHTEQKNYALAAQHFDLAIAADSNPQPQRYIERYRVLRLMQPANPARIENGLKEGVARHGEIINLLELLVEWHQHQGQWTEALAWLNRYPEPLRQTPQWWLAKGHLLKHKGDTSEAQKAYQTVIDNLALLSEHKRSLRPFIQAKQEAEAALIALHRT
jgi:tetratricopeptide (TPR) repeat protein